MSIAILFNNKDPKPWQRALQNALPQTNIQVHPYIANPESVEFVLYWKADPGILSQFPNLKAVQSAGASVEQILKDQRVKDHWQISRIVDQRLSDDMFEFLLTAVLCQMKNFKQYHIFQQETYWRQLPYKTIPETCVTILGLGAIGKEVAEKFAAFGFKVKGWARTPKTIDGVASYSGQEGLIDAISETDFLINILPLTPFTRHILNASLLNQTSPGTFLINVGRGTHLVESDLMEALESGHLSGALLDVFQKEPLAPTHPFWNHPKIMVSPHVASLTNIESATTQIVNNFKRLNQGEPLQNQVSLEKGY